MYLDFWNLRESPFQNIPDPRFAYMCPQHHEGLARLVYLVQNRKLGGVLTGPYGVGKSMVLELLAQQVRKDKSSSYVGVDYLPGKTIGFARQILSFLGFREEAQRITEPVEAITLLSLECNRMGHTVLTIDEAQTIQDPDVYHFLHLLMNIYLSAKDGGARSPAFTLILAGYNDMTKLLSQDESLCQRLQMVWHLDPLDEDQILEYVQHRVRVSGGDIWIFEKEAVRELEKTRGIPRVINNVCDVALTLGYAANARSVTPAIMRQALREASSFSKHLSPPVPGTDGGAGAQNA